MKIIWHLNITVLIGLAFVTPLMAKVNNWYLSPIAAARGNSYMAGGDSPDVVFYNPAAIRNNRTWRVTLPSLAVGANEDSINLVSKITDLVSNSNMDAGQFIQDFKSEFGKIHGLGASAYAGFNTTRWGVYIVDTATSSLGLRVPVFPMFDGAFYNDVGFVGTGSYAFNKDMIVVGMSFKNLWRQQGLIAANIGDIANMIDPSSGTSIDDIMSLRMGSGMGVDLGLLYKPHKKLKIGFSIMDIADTSFDDSAGLGKPDSIPMAIHTGVHGTLIENKGLVWDISADIRDLTNIIDSFTQRLHLGTEAAYLLGNNKLASFRMGLNQGFFTVGGGFMIWVIETNFAWYTSEIGPMLGMRPENKFIGHISLGF